MPIRNEAMDYLGERIRSIVGDDPRITEKMMFGGLTFLLNGRILVGCREDGNILLSVGRENHEAALARPGASAMSQGGRTMTGFIWVEADAIEDDENLAAWVNFALAAVSAKPPKAAGRAKKAAAKPPKTPATR
jgi:TfoX/Sxy family transcriptional regulator of competence genes